MSTTKDVQFKDTNFTGINSPAITDYEVRSLHDMGEQDTKLRRPWWDNLKYLAVGIIFGIVLIKAEVVSWFRIQEMFRLQSFHMYGVIGTAVVVGMISVWLI